MKKEIDKKEIEIDVGPVCLAIAFFVIGAGLEVGGKPHWGFYWAGIFVLVVLFFAFAKDQ